MRDYEYLTVDGGAVYFNSSGALRVEDGERGRETQLDYKSAVNLASALLQWATQLPVSERGSVLGEKEGLTDAEV